MSKKAITYFSIIVDKLRPMEVGDSFSKKDFIKKHWFEYDFFTDRSFSAILVGAKKEFPDRKFKSINKFITRIK